MNDLGLRLLCIAAILSNLARQHRHYQFAWGGSAAKMTQSTAWALFRQICSRLPVLGLLADAQKTWRREKRLRLFLSRPMPPNAAMSRHGKSRAVRRSAAVGFSFVWSGAKGIMLGLLGLRCWTRARVGLR